MTDLRFGKRAGQRVRFRFDGREIDGFVGESVAAALFAAGILTLRHSPDGSPRGAFCWMGACQECAVLIDGRRTEACRLAVADGLEVAAG